MIKFERRDEAQDIIRLWIYHHADVDSICISSRTPALIGLEVNFGKCFKREGGCHPFVGDLEVE